MFPALVECRSKCLLFFFFLLFPSKLNELLCYFSSQCSMLHPTVLITRCCFWRYEEQQSPEGDNRVNVFHVLQNSPFSELQVVFHDRWPNWWAGSCNISLAQNFSGFLEVSEGSVRIALTSRTLLAAWAVRSHPWDMKAGTGGVFSAFLHAKNHELVAVLSAQLEKSPQTGVTFLRTDHVVYKWALEWTLHDTLFLQRAKSIEMPGIPLWQSSKVHFLLLFWKMSMYLLKSKTKLIRRCLRFTGCISSSNSFFFPYLQTEK